MKLSPIERLELLQAYGAAQKKDTTEADLKRWLENVTGMVQVFKNNHSYTQPSQASTESTTRPFIAPRVWTSEEDKIINAEVKRRLDQDAEAWINTGVEWLTSVIAHLPKRTGEVMEVFQKTMADMGRREYAERAAKEMLVEIRRVATERSGVFQENDRDMTTKGMS
ncbi:hypothetical protein CALCODRAFT_517414 [Calocera cornea HHB12733]|uniref:Uncharacterized protein n=1 Tax=Calocera cornea HHB12733 TaxID=1353952 RepID=A0A165G3M4_9BASI|nr:hypothetical protein CALCODRAFT_517414 [Calocera cornea HHB12733]